MGPVGLINPPFFLELNPLKNSTKTHPQRQHKDELQKLSYQNIYLLHYIFTLEIHTISLIWHTGN